MLTNSLITGGTGFIGTALCNKLFNSGNNFTLVTNSKYEGNFKSISIKDLCNANYNESYHCLYHLATHFNGAPIPDLNISQKIVDANLRFSSLIARKAIDLGIKKIIITDSFSQYSKLQDNRVSNFYSLTKNLSNEVFEYFSPRNFSITNLILPDTYGPGDKRDKLFNYLKRSITENFQVLLSPGEQLVDYVHVDDVCEALTFSYNSTQNRNQNFDVKKFKISSLRVMKLRTLIEIINEIIGNKLDIKWGAREYRAGEIFSESNDFELLPDWKPKISLEYGLKETFAEFL